MPIQIIGFLKKKERNLEKEGEQLCHIVAVIIQKEKMSI